MKVIIAGAGIGGLALAQGLTRVGIDVEVIERDHDLSATRGYKLHLGAPAVAALRQLLTPTGVERLLGSAIATSGFALVVRDHRARQLFFARDEQDALSLDVDRSTLRALLSRDLHGAVRWGTAAVSYSSSPSGVNLRLRGGSSILGDVLVIADGASSRLSHQLAGLPTSTPTGLIGVAGRTAWSDVPGASRSLLNEAPVLALGPDGTGLFVTAHDPVNQAAVTTDLAEPATVQPVAIWGLIALAERMPPRTLDLDPDALLRIARTRLRRSGWTTRLVDVLASSIPASIAAYSLNAADPARIAPWKSGIVTALGDAVHAMPPTGGQGAATAILDAADLTRHLTRALTGEVTTTVAIHDYERTMRPRARTAVAESVQPLKWIRASATPWGSRAFRLLAPAVSALPRNWL